MSYFKKILKAAKAVEEGKCLDSAVSSMLARVEEEKRARDAAEAEKMSFLEAYSDSSEQTKLGDGRQRKRAKVTILVEEAAKEQIKKVIASPSHCEPTYRKEADGSSRGVLMAGECGREVWRGSKLLIQEASLSWRTAGCTEKVEAFVPHPPIIFAPKGKWYELAQEDGPPPGEAADEWEVPSPNSLPEAADFADIILQTTDLHYIFGDCPLGKLAAFLFYTDSGGSTLSQALWIGRFCTDGTLGDVAKKFVFWSGRCRIHQGAICGREAADMLLTLSSIRPRTWEKRTHLAALIITHLLWRTRLQLGHKHKESKRVTSLA
ncbi:unnamed protein product [Amoebophrya sp. A25]|nr:unnamed protein product [Amoebophrya sp. A25]|eukprot:GSA25T00019932001.1